VRNLFLALAAFGAVLTAPVLAEAATTAVTTSNVNLRAGPGTNYPSVAVVPAGTRIATYGCLADYSWCDVGLGAARGWIAAPYIQMVYGGNPVAVTAAVATAVGVGVVAYNRAYWDRYYVGQPWYGRWGSYYGRGGPVYGRGVTTSGAVACGDRGCAGKRTVTGPRGNSATRGGVWRR